MMIFSSTSHLSLARSGLLVLPAVLSHLHSLVHLPPLRPAIRDHLHPDHPVVSIASHDRCRIPLVSQGWSENTHIAKSWDLYSWQRPGTTRMVSHVCSLVFGFFWTWSDQTLKKMLTRSTIRLVYVDDKEFYPAGIKTPNTSAPVEAKTHSDILPPPVQVTCFDPDSVTYTRPNKSTATPVGRSNCSRVSPGPNPPATISPASTSSLQRLTIWAFESAI